MWLLGTPQIPMLYGSGDLEMLRGPEEGSWCIWALEGAGTALWLFYIL